jgi:hypothetical protein
VPSSTPTLCPVNFTDVLITDWFYDYVHCLFCRGAISGYADHTFRPNNETTRGQLAKIAVLGFALTPYAPPAPTFRDVPVGSAFYGYVETAYHSHIISGYDCGALGEPCPGLYYRANTSITRGQLSKIVVLAAGWALLNPTTPTFRDVPRGSTFYGHIEAAYCHLIISGYDCGAPGEPCPGLYFRPGTNTTRAQIAKIVCLAVRNEGVCIPPPTDEPSEGTSKDKP